MRQNDAFRAIIQVHEFNDKLLDDAYDERYPEDDEEQNIVLQIVEIIEGNYDYNEEDNQIFVAYEFLEGILSEPFDENKQYEALMTNEYVTTRDIHTLQIHELKVI